MLAAEAQRQQREQKQLDAQKRRSALVEDQDGSSNDATGSGDTPHKQVGYYLEMYRNSGPAEFQKSFGSCRNHHWFLPEQNSLKNALFPNCFKLFHKLIQLTKTISDYGEEIKVFRQFLEEVCFFFLHICFRIRRTAFLNKQTDDKGDVRNFLATFFRERKCRIAQSKFRFRPELEIEFRSGSGRNLKTHSGTSLVLSPNPPMGAILQGHKKLRLILPFVVSNVFFCNCGISGVSFFADLRDEFRH